MKREFVLAAPVSASPGDDEDARHTALFDPDTVYPVTGIGGDNVPDHLRKPAAPSPRAADGIEAEKLYSQRERLRVAPGPSRETVKRIADRAERNAAKREP